MFLTVSSELATAKLVEHVMSKPDFVKRWSIGRAIVASLRYLTLRTWLQKSGHIFGWHWLATLQAMGYRSSGEIEKNWHALIPERAIGAKEAK